MQKRRPCCLKGKTPPGGRQEECAFFFSLIFLCVFLSVHAVAEGDDLWEPACVGGTGQGGACCRRLKAPTDPCAPEGCTFSADWVAEHAPFWAETLSEFACADGAGFDVLEVGAFEGRSAVWFTGNLHVRTITCVDTFQGGEEQSVLGNPKLAVLEETFDANMRAAGLTGGVLHKHKGTSHEILPRLMIEGKRYDLIYIDGGHTPHATQFDAVLSLHLARVGGVIVFDDYNRDELATAIDCVVAAHVSFVEILDQRRVAPRQFAMRKVREITAHTLVFPETRPEMLGVTGDRGNV
jgi:predicted O-methyltransferase YrrM